MEVGNGGDFTQRRVGCSCSVPGSGPSLQSWGEGGVRGSGLRAWPSLREQVAEVDRTPAILHFTGRSYAHATYSLPVMILERPDYNLKVIQWIYSQSS